MSWEVPTMQSKTSFFNRTIFCKCLTRFWPLWLGYAFVLFLMLPLPLLNRLNVSTYGAYYGTPVQNFVLEQTPVALPMLSCIFGVLVAAAMFDFLFTARGTGLMASLPVRREGVFASCYAAGALLLLSSDALTFLLALGVEAIGGAAHVQSLLIWLAVLAMENLLFYSIAVFCAMLTGHILILPCLYLLFNVGVALLQALVQGMLGLFLFGLNPGGAAWGLEKLSPIVALVNSTSVVYEYAGYQVQNTSYRAQLAVGFDGWWVVGGWCIAGLLLAVCALLLYRRRRMECAGDTVSIPVLRPVLKYIVTLFFALGFPLGMYSTLFAGSGGSADLPAYLAFTVLGVVIGYYLSEMIIHKSLRVFRGRWKGMVVTAVLCCALVCAVDFDLVGYERRVPDADSIASVNIDSYEVTAAFRETDNVRSVCALHQSIVDNKSLHESALSTRQLTVSYELKNGRTLFRSYRIADDASQYTADSDLKRLEDLMNTDEAQLLNENRYPAIPVTRDTISYACVRYYDTAGAYVEQKLTAEEALALYENAIVPDCADGTLCRRWLLLDETYAATVYDVEINIDLNERVSAENYSYASLYFHPQTDSARTVAWLQARGVNLTHVTANTGDFNAAAAHDLRSIG